MLAIESKQDAETITRELLAVRLFDLFMRLDETGYPWSSAELRGLQQVTRLPTPRVLAAVRYLEARLAER